MVVWFAITVASQPAPCAKLGPNIGLGPILAPILAQCWPQDGNDRVAIETGKVRMSHTYRWADKIRITAGLRRGD